MKKLLILSCVLGLTACDRPVADVNLRCGVPDEQDVLLEKRDAFGNSVYRNIELKLYEDYAVAAVDGGRSFQMDLIELQEYSVSLRADKIFSGVIPETEKDLVLQVNENRELGTISVDMQLGHNGDETYWRDCKFTGAVDADYIKAGREEMCFSDLHKMLNFWNGTMRLTGVKETVKLGADGYVMSDIGVLYVEVPDTVATSLIAPQDRDFIFKYNNYADFKKHSGSEFDVCELLNDVKQYVLDNGVSLYRRVDMRNQ